MGLIIPIRDAMFAAKTLAEWRVLLGDIEGVWAPVLTPEETLADEQVRANDYLRPITLDNGETFEIVPSPIQFDEVAPDLRRAPDHGEHGDDILRELGYTDEQLIDFKIAGAIL
ncbi:MAG: CoA transferase [Deltaproteobacteria bacterium]|nr:CoA transferase [Deltaproteobacteria bacterium]